PSALCTERPGPPPTPQEKRGERFGRVVESRQTIVHKPAIAQLPVLINQTHKHRLTETENRRTFVLRMALQRVNHFSRIGQRHVAKNFHLSGFTIDFDFGSAKTDLPKW